MVNINGANIDTGAPFGGSKMLGDGREFGSGDFEAFLAIKAFLGYLAS